MTGPQGSSPSCEVQGGVATVRVSGDVDLATVRGLDECLAGAVRDASSEVVVDLSDVTFLGSEGVRSLVSAAQRAESAGVGLRVCAASKVAARVLTLSSLDGLLSR